MTVTGEPVSAYLLDPNDLRPFLMNINPEKVHLVFKASAASAFDEQSVVLAGAWVVLVKNPGSKPATTHIKLVAY